MSENANQKLHLPSLQIKGFRGLRELTIPNLGRVTLLVGRNGVGKTTILEAVKLWAKRGKSESVVQILSEREELFSEHGECRLAIDDDDATAATSTIAPLFFRRNPTSGSKIEIGPAEGLNLHKLTIEIVNGGESLPTELKANWHRIHDTGAKLICTTFGNRDSYSIWHGQHFIDRNIRRERYLKEARYAQYFEDYRDSELDINRSKLTDSAEPTTVACISLGSGLWENNTIAKYWERFALTDHEVRATKAINIAIEENVERLASVHDRIGCESTGSGIIARLNKDNPRVPLKSLGEGAMRLLCVALALSSSKNGFLAIEEAENGIHHTIHEDLWKMIMNAASESNVQVIATTHSFDCIAGFARAAIANKDVDGVLVRIEQDADRTRAVSFDEDGLKSIEKHGFEVR